MKSKKIKVAISGMEFVLPAEVVRFRNDGTTPYIYGSGPIAGKLVKAYVKAKYPTILVWAKSSSFANGNSLDVYVCNPDGTEVETLIYSDINAFANAFEYGRYNGMEETFDYYDNAGLKTDKGMEIEAGVKYVHTNNKAPFGSYPDVIRMISDMMAGKYVWGPLTLEKAIEKVKSYKVSDSDINKALPYLA